MPTHERDRFIDIAVKETDAENFVGKEAATTLGHEFIRWIEGARQVAF